MQSASPEGRLSLVALPGAAWQRTRRAVPASTLWSALLVFLLAYTVARSTVAAGWGIEAAPVVALAGAVFMGLLAVTPLSWWWCVGAGFVLAPVVAAVTSAPALRAAHPLDPIGWPLIQTWLGRIADGSAFGDTAFVLFIVSWLMWVTGAWLSWCVLRWRQPMVGLIPGAAAFATNVLNSPDQTGYTLGFLLLTFALLLWTNYTGSVANAQKARVKLTGDARWDLWESGLVATAAVLVLAFFLPPLSTVDRTTSIESSLFQNWAQLQQQLTHAGANGTPGSGGTATTGFSQSVGLGASLTQSKATVFTYTVAGNYVGPKYFRGLNIVEQNSGQWSYEPQADIHTPIAKNAVPSFGEDYRNMTIATFTVNMVLPPAGYSDIVFYPGQLYFVDRPTLAIQEWASPAGSASNNLVTIDRLSSVPPLSTGTYHATVMYPEVTADQLRQESTTYSDWLQPYMTVPPGIYRRQEALDQIRQLAMDIVKKAGATNPYDEATAIQDYLRNPNNFHYTLSPKQAPGGWDSLWYFLSQSHEGYCQWFATAMGDMLRLLGIPTRLVNGYGPGTFDTKTNRYVVRDEDAHTWVETYFPDYGWVPFEPTADSSAVYNTIPRGTQSTNLCLRISACQPPPSSPTPGGTPGGVVREPNGPGGTGPGATGSSGLRIPDAGTLTKMVAVLLAVMLLLAALGARYLRPRTVMGVWKRTLVLARLAGTQVQPAETPLELSRRLARVFPEAAASIRALAGGFVVAAYAPPDVAHSAHASVMEAWAALRPLMLRRVAGRFRLGRA